MLTYLLQVCVISAYLLQVNGETTTPREDLSGFYSGEVVPDIIDVAPESAINVNYGDISLTAGDVLTPTQVQNVPSVSYYSDPDKFYTLAFVDPDVPNRQNATRRSFKHWLVVNIPGDDVSKGDTLAEYISAGPTQGTGLHRYVFLLFAQPKQLQFDDERVSYKNFANRSSFSIRDYASKHGLGDPVAGNYFQAEWDDYVPKLYAKLTA